MDFQAVTCGKLHIHTKIRRDAKQFLAGSFCTARNLINPMFFGTPPQ
jgi:hypothetical protein